jgi:hypothetical protein
MSHLTFRSTSLRNTLPVPIIVHFIFVLSQTKFDQVYRKKAIYLQHQVSFIEFNMKYVLVVHLFCTVDAIVFFCKPGQS